MDPAGERDESQLAEARDGLKPPTQRLSGQAEVGSADTYY